MSNLPWDMRDEIACDQRNICLLNSTKRMPQSMQYLVAALEYFSLIERIQVCQTELYHGKYAHFESFF